MQNVLIIAEAGVNHNGKLDNILKMIQIASDSGADYIKFQTFRAENLVTRKAKMANYQIKNFSGGRDQYQMLKNLEIKDFWYKKIKSACEKVGIGFLSSPFDTFSVSTLATLGMDYFKIPSGEITNKLLLMEVAKYGKRIILSSGMSTIDEIKDALNVLYSEGVEKKNIFVLHCNTDYPTKYSDTNILAIKHISKKLDIQVGYSDHTIGFEASIMAVSLGAKIIEKHFTIDKKALGPDHKASLSPLQLKKFVSSIRKAEKCTIGDGYKKPTPSELKNKALVRKSLYYRDYFKKGDKLEIKDFVALRPDFGISPMEVHNFIEKKLKVNVNKNQLIKKSDFE